MEHYKEYQIGQARYDRKMSNQMLRCRVCREYTDRFVEIPECADFFALCDAHCNEEGLRSVLSVGECWSSY